MEPSTDAPTIPGLILEVDEGKGRLLARLEPLEGRTPLTPPQVREALAEAGYGRWAMLDNGIAQLVRSALGKEGAGARCEVAERRDGDCKLTVSKRRDSAMLVVDPPQGGAPVRREQIDRLLVEKGVVAGVDGERIDALLAEGQERSVNGVVARSIPPQNGEDTRFESLVPEARERRPFIDEHGRADYRNLGEIVSVEAGETVMRRHPATPGIPGRNVLGEPLPAKPGRDAPFSKRLENVEIDADDPNLLRATISGIPVVVDGGVHVEESLEVEKVDLSVGNLNFKGTIAIRGDVINGMTVVASGDIIVQGMVEAATLKAGGDIVVKNGVVGHLLHGEADGGRNVPTAHLQAAGTVSARFLENAVIEARDVVVQEQLVHSHVRAHHAVTVGGPSARKGQIMGGMVRARERIECLLLGSPSSPRTVVEVGLDPELEDRLSEIERQSQQQQRMIDDLMRSLAYAREHPERAPADFARRADNTLDQARETVALLARERHALKAQMARCQEATIVVHRRLYPGVEVVIAGKIHHSESESVGGTFELREGSIYLDHRK